ncbi:ABC transporter ATP-binding protein [Alicyclobacillus sp. ALC3]|uniref:ABC transporter ATP-binding protein n=1 Tax=Alicyclobacillus sp. ALC3 TaxID=2796143 RepID=UPI00237841FC|nr:ABC transporter ATP-binding protein [Alicyclobacillus sp. ALC3]WDL95754.1 ABC transporter ATP-binding protein [Alicyclobacillus sp. ALC3]
MAAAIELEQLVKTYGGKTAVDRLSLTIESGSVVALLGPNGAGKTTAISMMLGLRRPTSGVVRLLGKDPVVPSTRNHIGAMLQQVNLPEKLSVTEVLKLFRSYYEHPLDIDQLIELAGLEEERKSPASRLSGGQQRRLQFALAMTGNPKVLFLDEPTTGMDVTSRRLFWDRLRGLSREGNRTIVLTTHHLEEADSSADRVVLMQHGRKIADGSPAQLKALAGFKYISFTAGPSVNADDVAALADVRSVDWSGRRARVQTQDSDQVLRTLLTRYTDVTDIEVTGGGLEDAFISLTETDTESQLKEVASK